MQSIPVTTTKDSRTLSVLAAGGIPALCDVCPLLVLWSHSSPGMVSSSAVPQQVKICNFPLLQLIKCQHFDNLQESLLPLAPLAPKKSLPFNPCLGFTGGHQTLRELWQKGNCQTSCLCHPLFSIQSGIFFHSSPRTSYCF